MRRVGRALKGGRESARLEELDGLEGKVLGPQLAPRKLESFVGGHPHRGPQARKGAARVAYGAGNMFQPCLFGELEAPAALVLGELPHGLVLLPNLVQGFVVQILVRSFEADSMAVVDLENFPVCVQIRN